MWSFCKYYCLSPSFSHNRMFVESNNNPMRMGQVNNGPPKLVPLPGGLLYDQPASQAFVAM